MGGTKQTALKMGVIFRSMACAFKQIICNVLMNLLIKLYSKTIAKNI
jgi:hypothetical protein